mgnify:CR=1 FL=1
MMDRLSERTYQRCEIWQLLQMAYAVPQQYSQMMLRSSELGNSRIVAGMHSCLDVIGGRNDVNGDCGGKLKCRG